MAWAIGVQTGTEVYTGPYTPIIYALTQSQNSEVTWRFGKEGGSETETLWHSYAMQENLVYCFVREVGNYNLDNAENSKNGI